MTDPSIYRTQHPDVWACIRTYQAERKALSDAISALREQFDMGEREAYITNGFNAERFAGFGCIGDDWRSPPPGWRRMQRRGIATLVPYKAKHKCLPELVDAWNAMPSATDYRTVWPGMPAFTGIFRSPATNSDKAETTIYADWGEGHGPSAGDVDLTIWEPVKRSDYWALIEAGDLVGDGKP